MDIPAKIRQARKQAHLSQQELSEVVGVSDKAISAYEVGRSAPRLTILQKIGDATNQPLSYFIDQSIEADPDQIIAKLDDIQKQLQELRKLLRQR